MARRKSLLVGLISSILSTVLLVAIVIGVLCAYVKIKYDVNIVDAVMQVKTLNEEYNPDELFSNRFTEDDYSAAQLAVNGAVAGLISYSEQEGYKLDTAISGEFNGEINLTDKQSAALLNMILKNQTETVGIQIAGETIEFELVQIKFDNFNENKLDFNVVVKLDITKIKENMSGFPLNYLSNFIPDNLYISSTMELLVGDTPYEYSIESKSLTINNLNKEQTESLLSTLNLLMQFGEVETLNTTIGGAFVNALLGNSDVAGFAYSLKDIGATDFNFSVNNEIITLNIF